MDLMKIEREIATLYGENDWARSTGVVHVAAIASPSNRVIALGRGAPRSAADRFVLGLARARADAILTTGSILRAEPDLVHRYSEDPEADAALAGWRRHRIGLSSPPALIVLSASGKFPTDHPALLEALSGFIWTSEAGGDRLAAAALDFPIEVEPAEAREEGNGVALAIEAARQSLGAKTILIEAGPSTSTMLYRAPSNALGRVDELLLSHFEGVLEPEAVGPLFVPSDILDSQFGAPCSSHRIEEPSGAWRFERRLAVAPVE